MYRHNYPHHPYSGTPFTQGDCGFRSPMDRPRFQSSPRYQQQFSPFHSGGQDYARGPPRYHPHPNSHRGGFQSPPHLNFEGQSPHNSSYRGNGRDRRFSSPGNGRGRGKFNRGDSSSSSDCNPGGSDDIRMYYNPSMVQDPWANLHPVVAPVHSQNLDRSSPSRT